MPAAGDQPAERAPRRRFRIHVDGLRIVAPREADDVRLVDDDLADFIAQQKSFAATKQSWSVDVGDIDTATWDLSVKNPNGGGEVVMRTPQEILDEIEVLDAEAAEVLKGIRELVA